MKIATSTLDPDTGVHASPEVIAARFDRLDTIDKPGRVRIPATCKRCGGAGGWHGWPGYTCFRCGGHRVEPNGVSVYAYPSSWTDQQVADHAIKRADAAQRRADRKAEREAAQFDTWLDTLNDDVRHALTVDVGESNPFVADVRRKARRYMDLSDRQQQALVDAVAREQDHVDREAAEDAVARPAPEGRVDIDGVVVSTKWKHHRYGSTLKMLVKADGFKVWGTVPTSLEVGPGMKVRFTASVEQSHDDPSFAFFKRPTKAVVIDGDEA